MSALLALFALTFASAERLEYKGTHVVPDAALSCGAGPRLLAERWRIVLGKSAWVNNVEWVLVRRSDISIWLQHGAENSHTQMAMLVIGDEGYVTLRGLTEERKPCRDTVILKRVR